MPWRRRRSIGARVWRRFLKWTDRALIAVEGVTRVQVTVEELDEELTVRIPLTAGGARLARCARDVGRVDAQSLIIIVPDAVAQAKGISRGSRVEVDNRGGRLHIALVARTPRTHGQK